MDRRLHIAKGIVSVVMDKAIGGGEAVQLETLAT
jgi:hypothetical protein